MSIHVATTPVPIDVLKTTKGKVMNLRIGKHTRAIALGKGVLKKAGLLMGAKLTVELMSDGSIVLRPFAPQQAKTDQDVRFDAALNEANLRFGDAFRRLAE